MEQKLCQCCGMPMGNDDQLYGTEKDGSKSRDYCQYCYDQGAFLADCSMQEMVEACVPHMVQANAEISEEQARAAMMEFFPTLKRWQKA